MLVTLKRFLLNPILDAMPSSFFGWRRLILKLMEVKVHSTARVNAGVRIYGSGKVELGENVWIGRNCHFYTIGDSLIKIEMNSEIGPECVFNCQSHKIGDSGHRAGDCLKHQIQVGSGVWIGSRATIICEKIGDGAVIGACSLVLKDVASNVMAAGVPAKVKKTL